MANQERWLARLKAEIYLDEQKGAAIQSIWTDIKIGQQPSIRTNRVSDSKARKLIERIISLIIKEGDIVLDAFAGSGTTLAVAEKLGRRWIGMDCGKLAIYTIQKRLLNLTNPGRFCKER